MAAIILTILIMLDQFTKGLVERNLAPRESLEVIPNFFSIRMSQNSGAAWGFLSDTSWGIYVLSIISLIVTFLLIHLLNISQVKKVRIVLTLIIAGSLGNLIDRIRIGAVTDFLVFKFGNYYFPSFNIADSCITIGAILLIIFTLIDHNFLLELLNMETEV